jgi:hypothetical protein
MSATLEALSDIRGQRRAEDLLQALRTILGDGDELSRALSRCPADERRAFLRRIQAAIEGKR